jgi:hypothetical protein
VAWADPELEVGAEALELLEPLELELPLEELEPELPELSFEELDVAGAADAPVEADVPVEFAVSLECVDPGRANATAPATATLATPTPVVAARTLVRPRFLAAIASSSLSPFMLQVSALGLQDPWPLPLN